MTIHKISYDASFSFWRTLTPKQLCFAHIKNTFDFEAKKAEIRIDYTSMRTKSEKKTKKKKK